MRRLLQINVFLLLTSILAVVCRRLGLGSTSSYSVMLSGEPLWWTAPDGSIEQIGGFFTTRFVVARSSQEAESSALRMVSRELEDFAVNPADCPVQLTVEQCSRLSGVISSHGGGFAFWPKDDDQFNRWTLADEIRPAAESDGKK